MSDWKRAIDEYNKAALSDATIEKYIASKNKAAARYTKSAEVRLLVSSGNRRRLSMLQQHCRALVKWRKAEYAATRSAHKANLEL